MTVHEPDELNPLDFSPKWPGLNPQSLFDVYCVHKCHRFTFQQMDDYPLSEFIQNVKESEDAIFGNIGVSDFVESGCFRERAGRFSLFPSWLIKDDVFAVIQTIYGLTDFVQSLRANRRSPSALWVGAFIVPQSVVSLYDHNVYFNNGIPSITEYLAEKGVANFGRGLIGGRTRSAADIGRAVQDLYDEIEHGDSANIVILVDRRQTARDSSVMTP